MKIHIIIYCGGLPTDRPVYKGQGSFPAGLMKDISVLLLLLRGRGNHTAVFVHLMLFCANLRHFKYWIEEKKSGLNISKDLLKIWVFSTEVTSIIKHKPMAWVSHMSTRKCRIQHVARQKKKNIISLLKQLHPYESNKVKPCLALFMQKKHYMCTCCVRPSGNLIWLR